MRKPEPTLPIPEALLRHMLEQEPVIVEQHEDEELFVDVELFPEL